jgi:hypothetical protein
LIGFEFGDNERGPVLHQAADEMHVAAEPVELGDDDRAGLVDLPGGLERGGELGPAVERVGTLAGLDLGEAVNECGSPLGPRTGRWPPPGLSPRPLLPCPVVDTRT